MGFDERNLPERELLNVLHSSLETLYLEVNVGGSFSGAIDQLAELAESFLLLAAIHIEYPQPRRMGTRGEAHDASYLALE